MPQYTYSLPSLGADSIRLLGLMPNQDKEAPVQCQLHHYPLQKSDEGTHSYEALSYVWGGTDKRESVIIDGCELPVTVNLHNALLRLRDRYFERIIWADSICINQQDEQEKERQIQLMAKIYGQADRVVVYLGEAADGSDQALEDIRAAAADESTESSNSERSQEPIFKLLERPWFRRIWVLQEVAEARRILIMCGSAQINGYAFCEGFNKLKLSYEAHSDLQSLIRSVTYLIRGAIFRPKQVTGSSDRPSLGELIDMYHTHEATIDHDMVYALLGMSSDDPYTAGLSPDYKVAWKTLLQRLTEFILFKEISVETWDKKKIAVIKNKGCILGKVSSVGGDSARYDRQRVDLVFNNTPKSLEYNREYGSRWTLQASAKSIQPGDVVCLLQGALKPTIIRPYKDHFAVIILAVTVRQSVRRESGYVQGQEPLASTESFSHDLLLVWNWEGSLGNSQNRARRETLVEINTLLKEYFETTSNKAARLCDVALVLGESEEYEEAEKRLQEAIEACERASERASEKEKLHTLANMDSLALIYKSRGQWKKAEDLLLQVVGVRKRVQGMGNHDTLSSIANLTSIYMFRGGLASHNRDMATDLIDRIRDNAQITEPDMVKVARSFDRDVLAFLLDLKQDVLITEEMVKATAEDMNEEIMRLLLDKRGDEVKITDEVVMIVAKAYHQSETIMRLLLEKRGDEVRITEEVIKAAARDGQGGEGLMKLLLDKRSNEVKIDEEVVQAAVENQYEAVEVMRLLFDERGDDVKITEEVVKAAAENKSRGEAVMNLLLDERGNEVRITEEVVKAAARNRSWNAEVMYLLLDKRGNEVKITEEVVIAAAENTAGGRGVMSLLLDKRGDEVKITEGVLKAAAGSGDEEVMGLLLEERGDEVKITEEVLKAAAGSGDKAVMTLLLEERGDEVKITEGVLKAAAGSGDEGVMGLLLDVRGDEVKITEGVLKAAAGSGDVGVMGLLLDVRGDEVKITEEVLKAAAGTEDKAVMILLLDQRGEEVKNKVTIGVLEAAAASGQDQILSLFDQEDSTNIEKERRHKISRLYNASRNGDAATVRQLVADGVPLDTRNGDGATPLMIASYIGHEEIVRILLATSAVDMNVQCGNGRTPLFYAAVGGNSKVVRLLLDHGAEPGYTDMEGRSPLFAARVCHHDRVIAVLTRHESKTQDK